MSLVLNSIVQFTKIGIERKLPSDIIVSILSKNMNLLVCDFCAEVFSQMYYERTCTACAINHITCCYQCWGKGLAYNIGSPCINCLTWWCGTCCNKIAQDRDTESGWCHVTCTCKRNLFTFIKKKI